MSYFRYNRTHENGRLRFVLQDETPLFGCNEGVVAKALSDQIPDGQQQPWCWHVDVSDVMQHQHSTGDVFIMDLSPGQEQNNNIFSFYELLDVWGYSYNDWTPALLRLRCLLDNKRDERLNRNDFTINREVEGPIFSFTSFSGGIYNGQLSGTWRAHNPAPGNSVLLWSENLGYFIRIIQQFM